VRRNIAVKHEREITMAYQVMYEGDGFIRKGPEPKAAGKEERVAVKAAAPAKSKRASSGGITMFRFTRLVFGR
jgi:hypothetical protein